MKKKNKKFKPHKIRCVPCPVKLQHQMLKNLRATASNGRVFPKRAQRARQILTSLKTRKQFEHNSARKTHHEIVPADAAFTSSPVTKKETKNFWQRIVNMLRRIIASLIKCLTRIPSHKITGYAAPTDA